MGGVLALLAGWFAAFAEAGDGFPPNGAWAYGSQPWGVAQSYRVGHSHHLGHSYVGWRSTAWHRPYAAYRLSYPRVALGSWSYCGWGASYAYGYPWIASPVLYVQPRYRLMYTVPSLGCGYPVYYQASYGNAAYGSTLGYSVDLAGGNGFPLVQPASNVMPQASMLTAGNQAAVAAAPAHSVAKPVTTAADPSLPTELLQVVDDMLRAGGYRQAATAYAQLAVRFGPSQTLFARRFIAQVASGEFEQASLIAMSAELAGYSLDRNTVPQASLIALGLSQDTITRCTEGLAKRAYERPQEAECLAAVGHWLHLAGDDERAELFLARAAQLSDQPQPSSPSPSSNPKFVSSK